MSTKINAKAIGSGGGHRNCPTCKTPELGKVEFITHILGKRHQKALTSRNQPQANDTNKRTVHVKGYDSTAPVEGVIGVFWKYGIRNAEPCKGFIYIEFDSTSTVDDVLRDSHYYGNKRLQVARKHMKYRGVGTPSVQLSRSLMNMLGQEQTGVPLENLIDLVVREIELKPHDYNQRERIRQNMYQFLSRMFPSVRAYAFGSSANNLGMQGCDLDLFANLGVNPWAFGTKGEKETKASNLTWFLAREIRQSRMGIKINAVPRARVPIVKFEDPSTGIQVDLSFRHGMPVYNTHLILQYTQTHPLVRPYLMIIRYWAKLQGVAGGGQPSFLITNYALTMLMLFYLMTRGTPIVPSVDYLMRLWRDNREEIVIGGWQCDFGSNVGPWSSRRHSASVIQLIGEFFDYYGSLEMSDWVICPRVGKLIDRESLKKRDMFNLPPCMAYYCRQDVNIQLDTPFCLQDPFELCHNIGRGLCEGPLAEFQYKCRIAATICRDVMAGRKPFSLLLEVIEITPDVLDELLSPGSSKTADHSQAEVIELDDSQDSVEILNESIDVKDKSDVGSDDIVVVLDGKSREVCNRSARNGSADKTNENGLKETSLNVDDDDDDDEVVDENLPENKNFKFPLNFNETFEFNITFDGSISGGKKLMTSEDDIAQSACSLIHFILQQCLKIEVDVVESTSTGKKRKSAEDSDADSSKRVKNSDGASVPVKRKHHRLAQYQCMTENQLWIGRKKVSKQVPAGKNTTPLQHEMAVTEVQVGAAEGETSRNKAEYMTKCDKLDFLISVWQESKNPFNILVTGDSKSDDKLTRAVMTPMFVFLSSFVQTMLKRVTVFVAATSSKS